MSRPVLTLQQRRHGGLVFDRRSGQFARVDDNDLALLELLCATPADLVIAASADPARARARVATWAGLGVFTNSGRLDAETLPPVDDDDGPEPPLLVHLEIHGRCTLRCLHCFAGELPHRDVALTRGELDQLFAELAHLGALRLALSGGEPFLRHDLLEVVDDAAAAGLFPTLTTNGLHFDSDVAAAVAARLADGRLGWLSVSLEGPDADRNDAIRGDGVFDAVLARLAHLRDHDAPFSLAFTVRPDLVEDIAACVDLAEQVSAVGAVFRPLYPTGMARRDPRLWLSHEQWDLAVANLARAMADRGTDQQVVVDTRGDDDVEPVAGAAPSRCGAGRTQASISLSGRVSPCSFLGGDFDGPSVRDHGFARVWRGDASPFSRVRDVDADREGGYDGGCRVRALATTGSVSGRDPWRAPMASSTAKTTRRGLPIVTEGR